MTVHESGPTTGVQHADAVPAFRDSVLLLEHNDGAIDALITTTREVKTFRPTSTCTALLPAIDGLRSTSDLVEALTSDGHERQDVLDVLTVLERERLVVDRSTTSLVAAHPLRDRRDRFLAEGALNPAAGWPASSTDMRGRLETTSVAVLGTGGLGTWIARSLAGLGVGELILIDADVVEEQNLAHQVVFTRDDIGRAKVESLRDRLESLFPDVSVRAERRFVETADQLTTVVDGAAFVTTAANTPTANAVARLVSTACLPLGIPHNVGAGYSHDLGTVGLTVLPGVTACWECLQSSLSDPVFDATRVLRPARSPVGMVPMVAGILANLVAWDVFRVVTGATPVLAGAITEISLSRLEFSARPVIPNPSCPCGAATLKESTDGTRS